MPNWGILATGPPGAGKSTYCAALQHIMQHHYGRSSCVVNLDFANDVSNSSSSSQKEDSGSSSSSSSSALYECSVDVGELISLQDTMESLALGPNGGLLYCLEYLEENVEWLVNRLRPFADQGCYFIFDTPGQAEIYTYHEGMFKVLSTLQKALDLRLCSLHLVDSHLCSEPFTFIAASLLSLQSMMRLELPHMNVLTKVDMRQNFEKGAAGYGLEQFTEMLDLRSVLPPLDLDDDDDDDDNYDNNNGGGGDNALKHEGGEVRGGGGGGGGDKVRVKSSLGRIKPQFPPRSIEFLRKFHRLHEKVVEVVEDYNLISFSAISVKDPASIVQLQERIDHATGFVQTQQKMGGKSVNEDDAFKNAVKRASSSSSQGGREEEEEDY